MCVVDGIGLAEEIKRHLKLRVDSYLEKAKRHPSLRVYLTTDDPASKIYVKKKKQACDYVGIECIVEKCENLADKLKHQVDDGIIIQLPLSKCLDSFVFDLIEPSRDVDVLTPVNFGLLFQDRPRFIPCTPNSVVHILNHYGVNLRGSKVVVINSSNIVGKPLAAMLLDMGATVTICNKHTPREELKKICLNSRIIVVAVGIPGFLKADFVSEGAIVIDVGINRIGKSVVGDVDFNEVKNLASLITPVPGGVGPLTVAKLLENTIQAAEAHLYL